MDTGQFENRRVRTISAGAIRSGSVVYAMSRDQRVRDNWALLHAQRLATATMQPLVVTAPVLADYPEATWRQASFSIDGLKQVESDLAELGIPFVALTGNPAPAITSLVTQLGAGALVTDFSPLRESRQWKARLADTIDIPMYEVDAHNVVPAWSASDKQEYAAYTFRPKVTRLLGEFLTDIPAVSQHQYKLEETPARLDWSEIEDSVKADRSVPAVASIAPGEEAAQQALERFLAERFDRYRDDRNNPVHSTQSELSPYLHFGQISAQRIAWEVQRYDSNIASQEAFVEQLIVRRELSDNYCLYNPQYDCLDGAPDWALATLDEHRGDIREHIYTYEQFESARTHDPLWNAAQTELTAAGKMHGYLRMYWAKKILEWSPNPEEAMQTAVKLNDRYELDGHDPNGYAGVAWAIAGVHDRPWPKHSVYGKVRYMNYNGCKRKFDVKGYIANVAKLELGLAG